MYIDLEVTIKHAAQLKAGDKNGLSDPYCKVIIDGCSKKTKTIKETLHPIWNETLKFKIKSKTGKLKLEVEVYDWDLLGMNDFLGKADCCFDINVTQGSDNEILTLYDRNNSYDEFRGGVCFSWKVVGTENLEDGWFYDDFFYQLFFPCIPESFVHVNCKAIENGRQTVYSGGKGGTFYFAYKDATGSKIDPHKTVVEPSLLLKDADKEENVTKICPDRYVSLYETRFLVYADTLHYIRICGHAKCFGNIMVGFDLKTPLEHRDENYSLLMKIIKNTKVTSINEA